MSGVFGHPSGLPENTPEGFRASKGPAGQLSAIAGQMSRIPANMPEKKGGLAVLAAHLPHGAGNLSGTPEKMPGNSDHPLRFQVGQPADAIGFSARRFCPSGRHKLRVARLRRTGVIRGGDVLGLRPVNPILTRRVEH
jgi:hypothetical protein